MTRWQPPWLQNEARKEEAKTCILSAAFRGRDYWLQKDIRLYASQEENGPTFHLIYFLSKHFPGAFMVSNDSFMSSSIQHGVYFVNNSLCEFKLTIKQGMVLGVATL